MTAVNKINSNRKEPNRFRHKLIYLYSNNLANGKAGLKST